MLNKCLLRDVEETDLEIVLAWRNSKEVRLSMYTDHQITLQEHKAWFKKVTNDPGTIVKIFQYDEKPLGLLNFTDIDRKNNKCYWGFYIGEKATPPKAGIMMGVLALNFIFERMGIRKLCAEVLAVNDRSLRFHRKLGFTEEGKFVKHVLKNGQYIDVIPMATFADQWEERKKEILATVGRTE